MGNHFWSAAKRTKKAAAKFLPLLFLCKMSEKQYFIGIIFKKSLQSQGRHTIIIKVLFAKMANRQAAKSISAGYETRGCDTPGRFAMDERGGKFSWSYVYFSK